MTNNGWKTGNAGFHSVGVCENPRPSNVNETKVELACQQLGTLDTPSRGAD